VIDRTALLADLKAQVRVLEDDLRERSGEVDEFAAAMDAEWRAALDAKRTAATYGAWCDDRVTQAAVAWILATVFVRFCEDNGLIDLPYLAGPGERLDVTKERQQAFFEQHPERTDRDWIVEGVDALGVSKVAAGLFDRTHNAMWTITPSHDAAKALLAFWRRRGEDGEIIHDFTDPEWGTRFLGDLYQDLSEHAKKTYALLQTPEFVEEFILDYTLEPAVDEFGLDGLRMIDPTCGSGHFLLGGFRRLLTKWEAQAPAIDRWEMITRALNSIHGVDKNPFAAAIARFRLLVAAMKAADISRLSDAPGFPINVAIGDSLLHGRGAPRIQTALFDEQETHTYVTEDIHDYEKSVDVLGIGSYHVVVGNPPYITVKDEREKDNYRDGYPSCAGAYALSVPFAERFFKLACIAGDDRRGAGYVGQITANSFMKREFGKKLIEDYLSQKVNLTHVIDTSGAYIPGHGTPTVILIGRRYFPNMERTVRAVLGIRGEPREPPNPAKGLVWQAIARQIEDPNSESEWISVVDLPRDRLAKFPWSLSGGGASEVRELLESSSQRLSSRIESIGFMAVTREDDIYFIGPGTAHRFGLDQREIYPASGGACIRDWLLEPDDAAIFPYSADGSQSNASENSLRHFWRYKRHLAERKSLSGTQEDRGLPWFTYSDFHQDRWVATHRIGFAFVASHNHFAYIPSGNLLIRSAPMIKLPRSATKSDQIELLSFLNSSVCCFWLKQVCQDKGNRGGERSTARYAWESFFEFTGTKLHEFPLPQNMLLEFGCELNGLASRLSAVQASAVCAKSVPTRERLQVAQAEDALIRARMIALQEELDWDVYHRYGLLTDAEAAELVADPSSLPELKLGQRAFEIAMAPRAAEDEAVAQWFARHDSIPITKIPEEWPEPYRRVVAKRIETIENRRDIALIERPECKRRWQGEPWEKKEKAALRDWLLDRCEDRALWHAPDGQGRMQPRTMTANRLADRLRADADVVSVAQLLAGPTVDLAEVLAEITGDEHVPCLAQYRYKESGLRKRAGWEHVWDLQRQEDRDDVRLDIPVPPKYVSTDFARPSYWKNRGKLDVPKERFISYPGANPGGDNSLLLGWAGWDHREQAHALMTLIDERATRDGWDAVRLTPMIAALAEVMPWVRQWHGEVDPEFGMSPAQAYDAYLEEQKITYGLSDEDLRKWRPEGGGRGRRRQSGPGTSNGAAPPSAAPEDPDEATS
jgi:hypothetical protein